MKLKTFLTLCAAAALPVVLTAPGKADEKTKAPFMLRNFAHRGLHSRDKTVPENSLTAFRLAVEHGYGMELDVQLSRDGKVVVFHDDDLKRVCGLDARVDELTFDELQQLRLCGTEERIPLFTDVLETVGGRTPIICELKTGRRNRELCEKTLWHIRGYKGDICIESFDPTIVAWFRKNAPDILRGQLAMPMQSYLDDGRSPAVGFALSNTLANVIARPQFISYKIAPQPFLVRLSEKLGAMNVGWTSHDPESEKGRDAVIFEFYEPGITYERQEAK